MLRKEKENIKSYYLEDGFKDTIITSNIDTELDKVIKNDL